ncbi:hypothetical protein J3R30DRAFT_3701648 [Lentinula aciculospora]|uniref:Uncharacterized protein n=1 Tax=Lentinula aciculospora TaxID=153920 RepID=A0A9W9AEE9_9AGAR|nr:hypothetical protein J3R30DRAFT_3701648 [Lentinula aciculospora]
MVDICLWCPLAKADAKKENPSIEYRRRRVSAPALVLGWQPLHLKLGNRTPDTPQNLPKVFISYSYRNSDAETLPVKEDANILDISVSQRQDSIAVNLIHGVATATCQPEAQLSFTSSTSTSLRSGNGDLHVERVSSPGGYFDCSSMLSDTESIPQSRVAMHVETFEQPNSSSTELVENGYRNMPPTPVLRRKKSYLVLHMSSPAPISKSASVLPRRQRPQSQPAASCLTASTPATITQSQMRLPITDLSYHMRAQARAQPESHQLLLGHPNRPYYTALRKNMAPPSSALHVASSSFAGPSPSLGLSLASVPGFYPPYPRSFYDDSHEFSGGEFTQFSTLDPSVATPPFVPFGLILPSPMPSPSTNSGFQFSSIKAKFRRNSETAFSKSDEMKLRLALAREVGSAAGMVDAGADDGYEYQRSRGMVNVKFHMRRLSKELKDFVTIKRRP